MPWRDVPFACPTCQQPLEYEGNKFTCGSCRKAYPVVRGVPRFVDEEAYAASFGYEWQRHSETQLDSRSGKPLSRDDFFRKTGLRPEELRDALVLDVGVGSGRYSEIAADLGATVVGIDLSVAAEVAHANLGHRAVFAQADLFKAPFADATFDVVFSIGVLHHTPSTRAATEALARLVRPGGILAIWVYETAFWYRFADLYRKLTTRMSPSSLYRLSEVASRLYYLHGVPVLGTAMRILVPISGEPNRDWRVLDTFDWYAPRYQWKQTSAEVVGWFEQMGFEEVSTVSTPVAVRGRRPMGLKGTVNQPGMSEDQD